MGVSSSSERDSSSLVFSDGLFRTALAWRQNKYFSIVDSNQQMARVFSQEETMDACSQTNRSKCGHTRRTACVLNTSCLSLLLEHVFDDDPSSHRRRDFIAV